MSLQAFKADKEILQRHVDACDVPNCETCTCYYERELMDEILADERARIEADQDSQYEALIEAERNGDEPIDFDPNAEFYDSRA